MPPRRGQAKLAEVTSSPTSEHSSSIEETAIKAVKRNHFRGSQEIVYIVVGPEKQRFGIHKDHLCSTSPYFKGALEGRFQEAALGEVVLKDTSVTAFEFFNEWLYTGKIAEELCVDTSLSPTQLCSKDLPSLPTLLDVWLLGGYLMVPQLQNYVADMMQEKTRRRGVVPTEHFPYFFQNTSKDSLMRKLMVDFCVWKPLGNGAAYRDIPGIISEEMGLDLLIAFTRRVGSIDSNPLLEKKNYHVPVLG